MKYATKIEATQAWVNEMNAVSTSMIQRFVEYEPEEWHEVTTDSYNGTKDDFLPMWGTMFSFSDPTDNWWLEEGNGIQAMSECGFRIYEHEEFGYFFGIDGAGYDFYTAHWMPLYDKRGLQWHDEERDGE